MKNIFVNIVLAGIITIIFTGCEGYLFAEGKVVDKETGAPLDSVYVNVVSGVQTMYTDSTGAFYVKNEFGGCVPKCKDIYVEFSRPGYKRQNLHNPEEPVTIVMERN